MEMDNIDRSWWFRKLDEFLSVWDAKVNNTTHETPRELGRLRYDLDNDMKDAGNKDGLIKQERKANKPDPFNILCDDMVHAIRGCKTTADFMIAIGSVLLRHAPTISKP